MQLNDIPLDYLVGLISVYMTWQMGNKKTWAPLLGLFAQLLWAGLAIQTSKWGLMLSVACYTLVHLRNWLKWREDAKVVAHG